MNFGEEFSLEIKLANKSYQQYLYKSLTRMDVPNHYQIILLLSRFGGKLSQKLLCVHLNIERPNMAAIIDSLVEKGYVTRAVNYKDRRGRLIVLTPKADGIVEMLANTFEHFEAHVTHEIKWQDMYNCLRVLRTINHNLLQLNQQISPAKVDYMLND
jgi:DNA-binding MarR family transcriptional regulator